MRLSQCKINFFLGSITANMHSKAIKQKRQLRNIKTSNFTNEALEEHAACRYVPYCLVSVPLSFIIITVNYDVLHVVM